MADENQNPEEPPKKPFPTTKLMWAVGVAAVAGIAVWFDLIDPLAFIRDVATGLSGESGTP